MIFFFFFIAIIINFVPVYRGQHKLIAKINGKGEPVVEEKFRDKRQMVSTIMSKTPLWNYTSLQTYVNLQYSGQDFWFR